VWLNCTDIYQGKNKAFTEIDWITVDSLAQAMIRAAHHRTGWEHDGLAPSLQRGDSHTHAHYLTDREMRKVPTILGFRD
jgi:hypothetical protein